MLTKLIAVIISRYMYVLSHFSRVQLFATLRMVACQASLSMQFSRQEYQSELPLPSPVELPNSGIKLGHCRQILYQLSYKAFGSQYKHISNYVVHQKPMQSYMSITSQ